MLISEAKLSPNALKEEVAIVTGAGRGIGYETARALIWLGAKVTVAEIDEKTGKDAAKKIEEEFGTGKVVFIKTDVSNDKDIEKLAKETTKKFGRVDIIINNATVFPMGQVKDTPIDKWDFSYRVNLRGPVLLAKAFLGEMINRKHGVFVCVSSSGAAPYMGAYEVFKTAQGELASTIAAEVEGTGVYAFTIGPGIVRTPGFVEGGGQVATFMGKSLEELLEMNKDFEISAEAAGTGFAASVALASKYHGQETSSIQVLREIGITVAEEEKGTTNELSRKPAPIQLSTDKSTNDIFASVLKNYSKQSDGWKKRNLFERQWISRDFKKNTGMSIDEMNNELNALHESVKNKKQTPELAKKLKVLAGYYAHQQDQLRGFEKNPDKLKENLSIIDGWINDIKTLLYRLS